MTKIILFLLLSLINCMSFAQVKPHRIKIILLGSFHFNQSLDSSSRLHSDIFSAKRQGEVEDIVSRLAAQKPGKIFLEFTAKNQPYYDSIYNDYLDGHEPQGKRTKANEIFQLGMKTAKKAGLKRICGMNDQPEELADSDYVPINKVDSARRDLYFALGNFNDSTRTNAVFYDLRYPAKFPKSDSLLQKSTLSKFLLYLNTDSKLKKDEYEEWNYFLSMGTGLDMSSVDYVGTFWYGTNLRNFNNVMRNVDYEKDQCYLVIYGSNHIPFLKYLFNQNPYFEVVELEKILD